MFVSIPEERLLHDMCATTRVRLRVEIHPHLDPTARPRWSRDEHVERMEAGDERALAGRTGQARDRARLDQLAGSRSAHADPDVFPRPDLDGQRRLAGV